MIIDTFIILISILNTFVRLLPISFYTGSVISSLVFDDFRATLLFIGFLTNELISYAFNYVKSGTTKKECALLADENNYYALPSSITQTVGFFFGFIMANTYYENNFKSMKFIVLSSLLALTIFSRINVGCENLVSSLILACIGAGFGMIYYIIVKDYYKPSINDIEIDNTF